MPAPKQREPLTDTDIWGLIFAGDHWNCGGWTTDGRVLICQCGTVLDERPA